jgi:hypothetical protein
MQADLILNVSRHCKQIDQCTLVQRSLPASWAVTGFPYVQNPPVSLFILVIFAHRSLLAGQWKYYNQSQAGIFVLGQ